MQPEDRALIDGLLAGEEQTLECLRGWIRAFLRSYRSRLPAELEDIEQEILLGLTISFREGRFRGGSSIKTFVRSLVHHKCIDRLRALSRRQWLDIETLELPSTAESPVHRMSRREENRLALKVVEQMPESCRVLWQLLQEGMRYREMSQKLGVSEGTLRARVLRCRRRALELRDKLSDVRGVRG